MSSNEPSAAGRAPMLAPLLTAFVASGAIMIVELTAGRLISRYLGSSLYTWTSIIAVIMAGMSVGNAVGGYIADRYPPRRALAVLFLLAAGASAIVLPVNDLFGGMEALMALSWPVRIFLHVSALFFLPAVTLGAIGPVVVRLALALGGPQGRTVGFVYAASVAGSIFFTFLTGYYLVYLMGVTQVFLLAAGTLATLGIAFGLLSILGGDDAPAQARPSEGAARGPAGPWWPSILTVFVSNFAFMTIELGAGRALSRDYGNSIYTWTATIGVFLAGITLGNALGGWTADRGAGRRVIAWYFFLASATTMLGPLGFRIAHEMFLNDQGFQWAGWGTRIAGTLAAGFFVPCVFLGYISPLIVKRGLDAGRPPGRTVASVYAWGSVGAVAGTLASGYFLIDWLGSLTVVCVAGLILAIAATIYAEKRPVHVVWAGWAACLCVAAYADWPFAKALGNAMCVRPKEYKGLIYEDESQYSFIAVRKLTEDANVRELILDKLAHSEIDFSAPFSFKQEYEWIYDTVVEKFYPTPMPLRTFFIGGGGFIFPRYFDETRPNSYTEVTEIDPAVTQVAFDMFGLRPDTGMLIHNMDARNRITTLVEQRRSAPDAVQPYDIIIGDSFNDFSVPSHLTTLEFTQEVNELLREDGIYLLNMIDMYDPGLFLSAFVNTVRTVFPFVYVFNSGAPPGVRDTFVIVCSKSPRNVADLPARIRQRYPYAGNLIAPAALDELIEKNGNVLLTDNYAPTEVLLMPVVRKPVLDGGQIHYQNALEALARGDKETALAEARIALLDHPYWSQVHLMIADLLVEKNDLEGAIASYREALRNTPDPAAVQYRLGTTLVTAQRIDEAMAAFRAVLESAPEHVDALLKLSAILLEKQNTPEAVALLERASAADPKNILVRYNLGFAFAAQQAYPQAIAAWEEGLKIDPTHADTLYNLLLAYVLTKDYDNAFRIVRSYAALGQQPPAELMQRLKTDSGRSE